MQVHPELAHLSAIWFMRTLDDTNTGSSSGSSCYPVISYYQNRTQAPDAYFDLQSGYFDTGISSIPMLVGKDSPKF